MLSCLFGRRNEYEAHTTDSQDDDQEDQLLDSGHDGILSHGVMDPTQNENYGTDGDGGVGLWG